MNKETTVVVTGLPRSGTSLMMQMLEAGGLEVFTDGERKPDEHNPKGYYEHSKAKRLPYGEDQWLDSAKGKCVKVVAPLFIHLPMDREYIAIYMERSLQDMIISSEKMGAKIDEDFIEYFRSCDTYFQWYLKTNSKFRVIGVMYEYLLQEVDKAVNELASTLIKELGVTLYTERMKEAVDPSLWRNREGGYYRI